MGGLFGGGGQNVSTSSPVISSLRLQTSTKGKPIPLLFGKNRITANMLDYQDFTAIPHTTTQSTGGGKGGGDGGTQTNTTYTYTAVLLMGLCEGSINAITRIWADKSVYTDPASLGFSVFYGNYSQNAYGYMLTRHPERALAYRGLAYVAAAAYDLGDNASIPNHSFEIDTPSGFSTAIRDANPQRVILDVLTNPYWGAGFPADKLGDLSGYADYCAASGLFVSPVYTDQQAAHELINTLLGITNAGVYFSEGKLKIGVYGDAITTANGVTFTPDLTPVYDLTDDDFLEPPTVQRTSNADAFNRVQVKFNNRDNDYNEEIAEAKDQANIEIFGLRPAPEFDGAAIADPAVARSVAQILLQRSLYIRNTYEIRLGWRYALLEPLDIVTLTDVALGLDKQPVRITEIEEDEWGELTLKAEEMPLGVCSAARYPHQGSDAYSHDYNADPGDCTAPAILESPAYQSTTGLMLGVAVNGQQPAWGGCEVWVSLDGSSYRKVGAVHGGARYGTLTNAITSASGQAAAVQLVGNSHALISASEAEAASNVTLSVIGNEMVSYGAAQLTGANQYTLTLANRGVYSSTVAAHGVAERFVRLDDSIEWGEPLDTGMVGKSVYFKLPSFNIYGGALQSLADVDAYPYVITGRYLSTNGGGGFVGEYPVPAIVSNFGCNVVADTAYLTWSKDPLAKGLAHYEIRLAELPANNQAVSWERAAYLATVAAGTETAVLPAATGVYLIKAVNLQGKRSHEPASILSNVRSVLDYTPVLVLDLLTTALLTDADTQYADTVYTVGDSPSVSLNNVDTLALWPALGSIRSLRSGYAGVVAEGYYYPAAVVDLENVYGTRIKTELRSHSENIDSVISAWAALGALGSLSEVDGATTQARLQVATSLDAVTWADWAAVGVIADLSARYYKFRVRLATTGQKVTPVLTRAVASFTMASRFESGNDVDIPAAGLRISFASPYKDIPALGVTLERLLGNWSYTLTAKTTDGFTVQLFKDGAPTAGRIDWLSNGYGLGQIII